MSAKQDRANEREGGVEIVNAEMKRGEEMQKRMNGYNERNGGVSML